jgi:hypothetical protein
MSSISKTADHVADHARSATIMARASLMDLGSQALRLINNIREREPNGVFLAHVGRRREPNRISPALWFGAGAAAASGAFLLFAPRGADLRSRIGSLMNSVNEGASPQDRDGAKDMVNEGGGSIPRDNQEHQAAH